MMLIDGTLPWWDYELYLASFANQHHNSLQVPISEVAGLRVGVDMVVFMRNSMDAAEIFLPVSGPEQFAGVLRAAQQLIANHVFPVFVFPGMEIVGNMQRSVIPAKDTSLHVFCEIKTRNEETKHNYKFVRKRITVENLKNLYLYLKERLVDSDGKPTGLCIQAPGNSSCQLVYMQRKGVIDSIIGGVAPIFFGIDRVFAIHPENTKANMRLVVVRAKKLKEHLQIQHDNQLVDTLISYTFAGRISERACKKGMLPMTAFYMAIDLAKSTCVPDLVKRLYQDRATRSFMLNAVTLMYHLNYPMVVNTQGEITHVDLNRDCEELSMIEIKNRVLKDRPSQMNAPPITVDRLYYGAGVLPTIMFKLVSRGILDHQYLSIFLTSKWIIEYNLPFFTCDSTIALHMELTDLRLICLGIMVTHMNEQYWNADYTVLPATKEYTSSASSGTDEKQAWIESILRTSVKAKPIFCPHMDWCVQPFVFSQAVSQGILSQDRVCIPSTLQFHSQFIHEGLNMGMAVLTAGEPDEKPRFEISVILQVLTVLQYFTIDGHTTALSNLFSTVPSEYVSFLMIAVELLKGGFFMDVHVDYSQDHYELVSIQEEKAHPIITRLLSTYSTEASFRQHDITKYYDIDIMIHQTMCTQMKTHLSMLVQACVTNQVLANPFLIDSVDHKSLLSYDGGIFEGFHHHKDTFNILLLNHLLQSELDGLTISEHLNKNYPSWDKPGQVIASYLHYWTHVYTTTLSMISNPEQVTVHPLTQGLRNAHKHLVGKCHSLSLLTLVPVMQLPSDVLHCLNEPHSEGLKRHLPADGITPVGGMQMPMFPMNLGAESQEPRP